MGATLRGNRNVAEAFWTRLGLWNLGPRRKELCHEFIDGQNKEKIYRGGDQQKRNYIIQKSPVLDLSAVDIQNEVREIWLSDDRRNEWIDDVFDQGIHNRGKCSTDHNGHCQVYNIATENKLPKSFQHEVPS